MKKPRIALWLLPLLTFCAGEDSVKPDPPVGQTAAELSWRPQARPFGVQLHIHGSMSESIGSLAGHVSKARDLGSVDVIWVTDHDWRMALYTYAERYGFENGAGVETFQRPVRRSAGLEMMNSELEWKEGAGRQVAHPYNVDSVRKLPETAAERVDNPVYQGDGALKLQGTADPNALSFGRYELRLKSDGHRAVRPLAANVTVRLAVYPVEPAGDHHRLFVRFLLSEQPPNHRAELVYWLGGKLPEDLERRRARKILDRRVSVVSGQWNDLTFPVTQDAIEAELGGKDNSMADILIGLEARRGATATALFDDLRIEHELEGERLLEEARGLAQSLSTEEIRLYVGQEMSYGVHVNALGSGIPLINYEEHPAGLEGKETVDLVHRHGGVAILNHPFGTGKTAVADADEEVERETEVISQVLQEEACFGADALEVGYPIRGGAPLEAHLEVWDRLGRSGYVITGVGTSDTHANRRGWYEGNNWQTWIWAPSWEVEDLLTGLRQGACYFGDPARFNGRLDLVTASGRRMGAVVVGGEPKQQITFLGDGVKPGWKARLISNGTVLEAVAIQGTALEVTRELDTTGTSVVRFCIDDELGPVVCSNPIYFYEQPPEGLLPEERRSP